MREVGGGGEVVSVEQSRTCQYLIHFVWDLAQNNTDCFETKVTRTSKKYLMGEDW